MILYKNLQNLLYYITYKKLTQILKLYEELQHSKKITSMSPVCCMERKTKIL